MKKTESRVKAWTLGFCQRWVWLTAAEKRLSAQGPDITHSTSNTHRHKHTHTHNHWSSHSSSTLGNEAASSQNRVTLSCHALLSRVRIHAGSGFDDNDVSCWWCEYAWYFDSLKATVYVLTLVINPVTCIMCVTFVLKTEIKEMSSSSKADYLH